MSAVTDLTKYRMLRQKPATDLMRWHEAVEQIALSNLRTMCAMQRSLWRLFLR